ncbi:MAG: hypothetical protein RRB13_08035 [bacterium]|nr:hypothetical protein [bacterium]
MRRWLLVWMLLWSGSIPLQAREYIDITGATYGLISIAPGPGAQTPLGRELLDILQWSGLFELLPENAPADIELSLDFHADLARLQLTGLDEMVLYTGVFSLPLTDQTTQAREEAERIIRRLTGARSAMKSGIAYITKSRSEGHRLVLTDFFGRSQTTLSQPGGVLLLPRWNPAANQLIYTYLGRRGAEVRKLSLAGGERPLLPDRGVLLEAAFTPYEGRYLLCLSINGNADIYQWEQSEKTFHDLTHRSSTESSPALSPDGKQLLFVSNRSGSVQIYQKDLTTGEVYRMTFEGTYNAEPAWSPSGRFFAFSGLVERQYEIFMMDAKGLAQRQVSEGKGSKEQPQFSPDGRQLLFVKKQQGVQKLYLMRIDGSYVRRLTDSPSKVEEYNPAWSPKEIRWPAY